MNKDYNIMFQQLVNNAIKDGWRPFWSDKLEGNDCELGAGDIATEWFYFISPQMTKEWEKMYADD